MSLVRSESTWRDRTGAALPTVALHLLLGYALVLGLGVDMPAAVEDGLKLFTVNDPPPPPPAPSIPARQKVRSREGAASPRSLKAEPSPLVAPPPIIPPPVPPPIYAAPKPGIGAAPSAGASALPGPGTGSGGIGTGTGSGGSGDGDGSGDWEDETPPRQIRGEIRDSDYPDAAAEAGIGGTVSVRYVVETNGRATGCRVTRSSGNTELDQVTCKIIEERFRFRPSRDADGNAVPSTIVQNHDWDPRDPRGRR